MKKFISLLTLLAVFTTFTPDLNIVCTAVDGMATQDVTKTEINETPLYSGSCGENVTYEFYESTGTLIISGTGEMYDRNIHDYNNDIWKDLERYDIKNIIIEDGVTNISDDAFYDMYMLRNVQIAGSVKYIGRNAFRNCNLLEKIDIPEGVVSIGDEAFAYCMSLRSIKLPKNLEYADRIFGDYYNDEIRETMLSKVIIYGYQRSEAEKCAFYNGCSFVPLDENGQPITKSSNDYDIPYEMDFSTGTLTIGGERLVSASYNNYYDTSDDYYEYDKDYYNTPWYPYKNAIKNVVIKNTGIERNAFADCKSLNSVTILGRVWEIGESAFENCTSLTSVAILSNDYTNIRNSAFANCTSLTSITLPSNVNNIGHSAFENCTSLKNVNILKEERDYDSDYNQYDNYEDAKECLNNTYIEDNNECLLNADFNWYTEKIWNDGWDRIRYILLNKTLVIYGEESNGIVENNFYTDCNDVETIIIQDGITEIRNRAFEYYDSLTSVFIPQSVENIEDNIFGNLRGDYCCSDDETKNITIYGFSGSSAEKYALENYIPFVQVNGFGENTNIGYLNQNYIYKYYKPSHNLFISGFGEMREQDIRDIRHEIQEYHGRDCEYYGHNEYDNVRNIFFDDNVTDIKKYLINEFNIQSIQVDKSNKYYSSKDGVLFNKDKTRLICCPSNNFRRNYTIPQGVTTIGEFAFERSSLKSVTIPASVTSIDEYAFGYGDDYSYNTLEEVYFIGTSEQWEKIVIDKTANEVLSKVNIHFLAEEYVFINEENFPDKIFRSYVKNNFDNNNDGMLSEEEIANIKEINCNKINEFKETRISDLKGIEHFTSLEYLYYTDNPLTSLDLSNNTNLIELILKCDYEDSKLTSLNLSNNDKLEYLDCSYNNLTSLDLSNSSNLKTLCCQENNLTSLKLNENVNLIYLDCNYKNLFS